MRPLSAEYFQELLADQTPPCISLYMPTLRAKPPAAENSRRFDNLIRLASHQLEKAFSYAESQSLLNKFHELKSDDGFWAHLGNGLAVFGSPTIFQAHKLQRPVPELVEVADSFHLKPLIRAHQFAGHFEVLCLTQRSVRLLEGNQDRLEEVELRGVPRSVQEALADGVNETAPGDTSIAPMSANNTQLDRFFRIVDQTLWQNHSRQSSLPIILCAVPEYHSSFQQISKNPNLLKEGIKLNPDGISLDRIREEAWKIIEPYYRRQIDRVLEEFGRARATQQGSEDLNQVAQAAAFARVGILLVDADKHIGGRLDTASGRIEFGDLSQPEFDDLLDDIAERVMKTGGQVLVMPPDQMPSDTGVAAIYRF
jgi:release factor family 3